MSKLDSPISLRFELLIAITIALVSLTTAVAAWRTNAVGSKASDVIQQALIDALKQEALANENWRLTYEQAGYARDYEIALAGIEALDASEDPHAMELAANLHTFLLPGLQPLGDPFISDRRYHTQEQTFDIALRFEHLQAEDPDITGLDPQASLSLAGRHWSEQRWLVTGTVLMVTSLFWLGLAQTSGRKFQLITFFFGFGLYLLGVIWLVGVEVVFMLINRGGL